MPITQVHIGSTFHLYLASAPHNTKPPPGPCFQAGPFFTLSETSVQCFVLWTCCPAALILFNFKSQLRNISLVSCLCLWQFIKLCFKHFRSQLGCKMLHRIGAFCSLSGRDVSLLSGFFVMFSASLKYPDSFFLMYIVSWINPIF